MKGKQKDDIISREGKRIGVFETKEQCTELISVYKNSAGFKDNPETCFKIFEHEVEQEYWRNEF